ncbi:c-type cytochrome [Aestuariibius sp. 2305UL40-4]|uniref:c-type cytochrome n=1 Tax=Aestuariibius violaceus TaxID=3234132 RepID=UPI00345EA700
MFDTMTLTKIVGGFCGAFLLFLLGSWTAQIVYGAYGYHEHEEQAYSIAVEGGEDEPEEEAVPFEEIFASADPAAGERVYGRCRACHMLEDGANGTGPHLYGVVNRDIGAVDGFSYSGALSEVAEVWTPENLDGFLENPRGWAPGTSMGFAGLARPQERADLIAYLETIGGS